MQECTEQSAQKLVALLPRTSPAIQKQLRESLPEEWFLPSTAVLGKPLNQGSIVLAADISQVVREILRREGEYLH